MRHSGENESARGAGCEGSTAALLATAMLWIVALAQAAILGPSGKGLGRGISLAVAIVTTVLVFAPLPQRRRLFGLALVGCIGFNNFMPHLIVRDGPFTPHLLYAAVIYAYGSLILAGAGALVVRRFATLFMTFAILVTIAGVATETALEREWLTRGVVRTIGRLVLDPARAERYAPHSEARSIYPSNPRGYFRTGDPRLARWDLQSHDAASAARLLPLPGSQAPDAVRVEIDRAQASKPWHIQLSYSPVGVTLDERYVVAFRAKADRPRTMFASITTSSEPWRNLGWYVTREVGTSWRDYVEVFRASATDEGRLLFDLGSSQDPIDIQDVQIRRVETGTSAIRNVPTEYAVTYRFNDEGCRGPDYTVPGPPRRRRILALGDSATLGVGVYEEDTFEAKLQRILNTDPATSRAGNTYDVINCGISGYPLAEQRRLFDVLAARYHPDVVIVSLARSGDTFRDDVRRGFAHAPGKLERLLLPWAYVRSRLDEGRRPPPRDFSDELKELRLLEELCERQNIRLVVVGFRTRPLVADWRDLVNAMSAGLLGTKVPWLDLGERMLAGHSPQDLLVHELDEHPNEIAHLSAAQQVAALLRARLQLE